MLLKKQTQQKNTSLSVTKKAHGIVRLHNYISIVICAKRLTFTPFYQGDF